MTEKQVTNLIEQSGVTMLMIRDSSGNKLSLIEEENCDAALNKLNDILPMFSEYKRIEIIGRKKKEANWNNSFTWKMEYPKADTETKDVKVSGSNNQSIGAMEVISMMQQNMKDSLALHTEIIALKSKQDQNDPTKWATVIREIAPMLGLAGPVAGATINGPQNQLVMGSDKKSVQEIAEEINVVMQGLTDKMSPQQMLYFVTALSKTPDLKNNINKINTLMEAIVKNPAILDTALTFLTK